MTIEQAIMVLECVKAYGIADDARKMAIEALKADKCYLGSPCEYQTPEVKFSDQEIKKTLQEIMRICKNAKECRKCKFQTYSGCRFEARPECWLIEEGAEE